ncbi:double-stranded RNA-binding protein 4-like [Papaver somniferum]|uniref:double-stranded RNA-binding protein 4-like n=1 Tax=Papaver somniferum TaxID=3469 RepID=UPI000E7049B2|nr:double-stranded RNA-binding protein 4-like [Papaver somniferum]
MSPFFLIVPLFDQLPLSDRVLSDHPSDLSEDKGHVPSSNCSGLPDYKNCLITYAQQSAVALPVYETIHGGFRCTVYLDGEAYRSVNTFGNPEDAEQDASKLALESIAEKIKEECIAIINKDSVYCKSILDEYAAKMKLPLPTYTTTRLELLTFISSVVFDGKTYIGHLSKYKKDAEQLAVINSILGMHASYTKSISLLG